ncbi:hypothetical protein GNX71_30720 [Variovorax sp. RKNM96]|uniref:toxin VasX n=1 Tax=Variovorax sp. RKNM96 TaxID=2681552 RepID=UPI00198263A5|nr:toxin VasX [Variovorax sp. RKNM96]QSI33704.1 hypothetical protein GNX71_30720 [Variovorax sp. RKNM96]
MATLEICEACSRGDCFAIYPTRFGVYPFLKSMPKMVHCEEDAPDHFYPHTVAPFPPLPNYLLVGPKPSQHTLTGGEWGLKVIQEAFVYLCFKNPDGSARFWEYFRADENGIFTRVQSVSDNVEESKVFCSRSGHPLYNKFIRISHAHTGKVAIGYSLNWLTRAQRDALLENEAALMTTIDLDQLKAKIVPDKQSGALAYKVESAESFDKIFEHQSSSDGSYQRTDLENDVHELDLAHPDLHFPAFATFYSGKKAVFRAGDSPAMFELMTRCTKDGSGNAASVPIILGLFDPLGTAEEFNQATSLAIVNHQIWQENHAWPLGSISEYERIAGAPVDDLLAADEAYNNAVQAELERVSRSTRDLLPNTPPRPAKLQRLDEHLRMGWTGEVRALLDEQDRVRKVIDIHAANHRNWIDLKGRNSQKRAFLLACEVFMRKGDDMLVDHASESFSEGTSVLTHPEFWGELVLAQVKREKDNVYSTAVRWARRGAISGKETVRDVVVKFYQKRVENLLLASAEITPKKLAEKDYQELVKNMIDEEVREVMVTANRAAFAFTALSAISQIWMMYMKRSDTTPEGRKNNWGRFFLTLLDARSLYLQAVTPGAFFYDEVIAGQKVSNKRPLIQGTLPNTKDVRIDLHYRRMFSSTKSEIVSVVPRAEIAETALEAAKPAPIPKYNLVEYLQKTSKMSWLATGLLSAGNVCYFLAALDAREQAAGHNNQQLANSQIALMVTLGLEVTRSLATRLFMAEACPFLLGPWGAVILIVMFLGIFIWQELVETREIEPYGLFLRRTYFGNGELDRHHEHFYRREIFFQRYPSLDAERLGFVKTQHAIRVTYRVDDERADFKFTFDNPESGAIINVYHDVNGDGARKMLIGHYEFGLVSEEGGMTTYGNTWVYRSVPQLQRHANLLETDKFQAERLLPMLTNEGLTVKSNSTIGRCVFSIDYIPRPAEHAYFVNAIFVDHRGEDDIYIETDEDRTYRQ